MPRTGLTVILTLLLSHLTSYADEELSDTVLHHALETGRSFVSVVILGIQTEEERGIRFYYYEAEVRKVMIAGDVAPSDVKKPIGLFAGTSYGEALTVGAAYALFVTKDAPCFFSWAHRGDVVRLASDDAKSLRQLERRAINVYAKTQLKQFRDLQDEKAVDPLLLPGGLKEACVDFRLHQGSRCESAEAIWKSDLGSRRDESRPWSSWISYLPPKVPLSRAQILQLLGKPTIKLGYTYKWFCGNDARGRAGVLAVRFNTQSTVDTLVYGGEPLNQWVSGKEAPTKASSRSP